MMMNQFFKRIGRFGGIILLVIIMATGYAWGYSEEGTTGANILKVGIGARPVSMGGAFSAVRGDVFSPLWNPAGASIIRKQSIAFMRNKSVQDISLNHLSYLYPLERNGIVGTSLSMMDYGKIEGRDQTGAFTGNISAQELVLGFSFAGNITRTLAGGLRVKYISQELDNRSGQSFALDIGSNYITPFNGLTLGLSVQHIGPGLKILRRQSRLPTTLRFGGEYLLLNNNLRLTADLVKVIDEPLRVNAGAEYTYKGLISLRAGFMPENQVDNKWTAGAGVHYKDFNLDYAFVPFGDFGNMHRISMSYAFGVEKPFEYEPYKKIQPVKKSPGFFEFLKNLRKGKHKKKVKEFHIPKKKEEKKTLPAPPPVTKTKIKKEAPKEEEKIEQKTPVEALSDEMDELFKSMEELLNEMTGGNK